MRFMPSARKTSKRRRTIIGRGRPWGRQPWSLGDLKEAESDMPEGRGIGQGGIRTPQFHQGAGPHPAESPWQGSRHFDPCFPISKVVVFSGHMIDQPGRSRPRFPLSSERKAAKEIAAKLKQLDARIGFASAACGAISCFWRRCSGPAEKSM